MTKGKKSRASVLRRELLTFLLLGLIGVSLLPLMIFLVGAEIFGDHASNSFGDFYREIHAGLRSGRPVVGFLVASPYVVWQLLRATFHVFGRMKPARAPARPRVDPEMR